MLVFVGDCRHRQSGTGRLCGRQRLSRGFGASATSGGPPALAVAWGAIADAGIARPKRRVTRDSLAREPARKAIKARAALDSMGEALAVRRRPRTVSRHCRNELDDGPRQSSASGVADLRPACCARGAADARPPTPPSTSPISGAPGAGAGASRGRRHLVEEIARILRAAAQGSQPDEAARRRSGSIR